MLFCWYIIGTLPILLGLDEKNKKIRGSDTVISKHKYITNSPVTPGDNIVNKSKQFTSAMRGSFLPPLVKSGINHLRALTIYFYATKEAYDEQREINCNETTAHSKKVPIGSPPPRVARDKINIHGNQTSNRLYL